MFNTPPQSLLWGATLLSHDGLLAVDGQQTNLVADQLPLLLAVVLTEELHLVGRKVHRVLEKWHEIKPAASHESKTNRKPAWMCFSANFCPIKVSVTVAELWRFIGIHGQKCRHIYWALLIGLSVGVSCNGFVDVWRSRMVTWKHLDDAVSSVQHCSVLYCALWAIMRALWTGVGSRETWSDYPSWSDRWIFHTAG